MPLSFQPRSHSSYEPVSDVSIPRPRVLPATLSSGGKGTEYQYSFYRGDDRIGGLGFDGPDEIVVIDGSREWVFTFDLGREAIIKSMLRYKPDFGETDDDFTFLRGLAQGLVLAYAGRTDNDDNLRYVAVTNLEALERAGVRMTAESVALSDGIVVLAEVAVPAHVD
ncbi:hypothetical protein [Stenotrophomonas sp. PD6]|uniref:hypothetical protein n=1 Tax=Stenotrophomonas sp. PD6 TaxID=3368612 RepID=UPI003B9E7B9C